MLNPAPSIKANKEREKNVRLRAKRLHKLQKKQEKRFRQALISNRPGLNSAKLLRNFEGSVRKKSLKLVKLALQAVSYNSAISYAVDELNLRLGAEDLTFNTAEVNSFARRIIRILILEHMLDHFAVKPDIREAIVNLQISKDFGTYNMPMTRSITPAVRGSRRDKPLKETNAKKTSPFRPKNPFQRQTPRLKPSEIKK